MTLYLYSVKSYNMTKNKTFFRKILFFQIHSLFIGKYCSNMFKLVQNSNIIINILLFKYYLLFNIPKIKFKFLFNM